MGRKIIPDIYNICSFVERTENNCWEWKRCKISQGYAQIRIQYTNVYIHRHFYELIFGKIPDGLIVLHRCDNRICINPFHLKLGTQQNNIDDMIKKGRKIIQTGETNSQAKLTCELVTEIRALAELKISKKFLAKIFNVCYNQILLVVRRDNWRSVPNPTLNEILAIKEKYKHFFS